MENESVVMSADYTKAVSLDKKIKAHAQIMQESLYEVCKGLMEMRDGKLYKELGYNNFNDYCETEVGIKRNQAYKYISIAENLDENFVSTRIQIGASKLTLLSKLDEAERTEITQKSDLESVSVRELEKQIKELKAQNDDLAKKNKSHLDFIQCCTDESQKVKEQYREKCDQVFELERKIEILEGCPIDIAVADNSEQLEQLTEERDDALKQLEQLQKQFDKLVNSYDRDVEEARKSAKPVAVPDAERMYMAYETVITDSFAMLVRFIKEMKEGESTYYALKAYQLIDVLKKMVKNGRK